MRGSHLLMVAGGLLVSAPAWAERPEEGAEDKVDVMHILARHGWHDLQEEGTNAYGQISLMGHGKAPFAARYTNLHGTMNSLLPQAEGTWTATLTLLLGGRLWQGAEAYVAPELISERPLSNLKGLGDAIQNGELEKGGSAAPMLYLSRVFLRQTIGLGGARVEKKSEALQLASRVDRRRIVVTLGKITALDLLDRNAFAGDVRRQFLNMAFMTHGAWDFASDARGYAWGGVVELYLEDWALRWARLTGPQHPNQLPIDGRIWQVYGDQIELEHDHTIGGREGAVRLLGYRNRQNMGRFDDAIAAFQADPHGHNATTCRGFHYDSANANAPDLCWARKLNVKLGIGVNIEQRVTDDMGVFVRGMVSDGQTEVYAYTSTDRSLSWGALSKGTLWRRPADSAGVAFGMGWISRAHAAYLGMGGVDGFVGDGAITQAAESELEVFYSLHLVPSLWLTVDYQHITNPGFNADRGPVELFGGRLHAEF